VYLVRALLFNIGFQEATRLFPWDCFVFHDVDLYPEDDRSLDVHTYLGVGGGSASRFSPVYILLFIFFLILHH
jgi:hypothetical protein